jgi:hypothetical protein
LLTRGLSNAVVWRAMNALFPGHKYNGMTRASLANEYACAGTVGGFPRAITYNELQAAIRTEVEREAKDIDAAKGAGELRRERDAAREVLRAIRDRAGTGSIFSTDQQTGQTFADMIDDVLGRENGK